MEGCSQSGEVRTEDWPGLLSFMGLSQNCYGGALYRGLQNFVSQSEIGTRGRVSGE